MDNGMVILIALVLLADAAFVVYALVTGRCGVHDRRTDPAEYWFYTFMIAVLLPLMIILTFIGDRSDLRLPFAAVMIIPMVSFWLVRLLQKGKVRIGIDDYRRAAEPEVYWTVVAGCAALLLAWCWLVVASLTS